MNYTEVYKKSFDIPSYSSEHHIQYDFAVSEIKDNIDSNTSCSLIDIGSGRGHLIKLIQKNLINIDITSIDLDKFNDIDVKFNKCDLSLISDRNSLLDKKYNILTCTDVFEHLDKSFIEDVIIMCSKISKICIFAIANHSDIINGVELHTIQENDLWWDEYLNKYFDTKKKEIHYNGQLYMYVCISKS